MDTPRGVHFFSAIFLFNFEIIYGNFIAPVVVFAIFEFSIQLLCLWLVVYCLVIATEIET